MVKHSTKVNNICSSLVHRSSSNDCPAYTPGFSNDQTSDFAYICKQSPAFVDKTGFIEAIIEMNHTIFTAPRHFGKSVNISMLKYFFEIEVNKETAEPITKADITKEPVTDTYNYKLFENLAVHRLHPDIMENWFGRHPVIHLDFSLKTSINSYQDVYNHCMTVVRKAFKQHSYLLNSIKYEYCENRLLRRYCDDDEFEKMKQSGYKGYWSQDMSELVRRLFRHFGTECIFLVDEYDAIFRACLAITDKATFQKCRGLCEVMIDSTIHHDYNYCEQATVVLSGISDMAIHGTRDLDLLSMIEFLTYYYSPLHFKKLYGFHGFSQQDFDFLMNKHNIPIDMRQQVTEYYSGYCSMRNRNEKFYNPYSVACFLQTKVIQSYWSNSALFDKCQFMFNFNTSDLIIKQLIFGQTLKIYFKRRLYLNSLPDVYYNKNQERTSYLIATLYEQGYLQIVEYHEDESWETRCDKALVKVANEDVRISLIEELKKYYKTCGKFDWESMKACAKHFDNIDFAKTQDLSEIFSLLEKYCNEFFTMNEESIAETYKNEKNEAIGQYFRRLIINIASLTKHKITITADPDKYGNFELARGEKPIDKITPDIKMCSDHGCIMILTKYNSTSEKALNQLILHSCRDELIKDVLIGLNLSENKRLSMSAKIGDNLFTYGTKVENSAEMEF